MCHVPKQTFNTDASSKGFGPVADEFWLAGSRCLWNERPMAFSSRWIPCPLLHESLQYNISFLELVAACLPLLVWAPCFPYYIIIVLPDNTQAVFFLNRGTTKNAEVLRWLKMVFSSSIRYDFWAAAVYTRGVKNVSANALSWLHENEVQQKRFLKNYRKRIPGPLYP